MRDIVARMAEGLTLEEKRELLEELRASIAEELAGPGPGEPDACPRCGCPHTVRKGRGADGSQRWLCRGCGSTFCARTMGLLALSKLGPATWMEFAACMADALVLRESASRCGVSLPTAWFMRMRVCEVMSRRLVACRPGTFHVDGTYLPENLSGDGRRSGWFSMPRAAHRRGPDSAAERRMGSFCVICGANELGDCFCRLCSRGGETAPDAMGALLDLVPGGSEVVTDGAPAYASAARWLGGSVGHRAGACADIPMANALHSRLKGFLSAFRGVATRRLQRYLDWFCWREQFKRSDADRRELLYGQEVRGRYAKTRRLTFLEPRVDYVWWVRRRMGIDK